MPDQTNPPTDPAALWRFDLRRGNSDSPQNGACLLDAVSWLEYGTLGDHPECVCDVIATYGRRINDALPDAPRQRLRAYIPRLVGTVDPDSRSLRAAAIIRHTICTVLPRMYDALRRPNIAARLRGLPADASMNDLQNAAIRARDAYAGPNAYVANAKAYCAAANAADAAAWAGDAAYDAEAAAYAAEAAANAADAAGAKPSIYEAMIAGLDVMLAIGRQAEPVPVDGFRDAVERFARAREAV